MLDDLLVDANSIQSIDAVPTILEAVSALTGLRFVCIARVTSESWTTCAVLDKLNFGLKVGDGLDVSTTLCNEVRETNKAVIIDCVEQDEKYRNHHTPRIYGFQSYISIPLYRADGAYFGTLCGLDPLPAELSRAAVVKSMTLFAQLISIQLESARALSETRAALLDERDTAVLREQFIAVLGHDLRNPLGSITTGLAVLKRQNLDPAAVPILERMARSAGRMAALVDDLVDFARGRMGGGLALQLRRETELHRVFDQVVSELQAMYPHREIHAALEPGIALVCDAGRMGQMLSNLLKNALDHGAASVPVRVRAAASDESFELAVSNGGDNIPSHVMSQFFKPFWRAVPQHGGGGLGLGLFIVAEIAESHGGNVSVVSAGGETTFTFRMGLESRAS
jgi:signal transduction histidine kinase